MISFLTEEVRSAFHLLPLDRQLEWTEVAEGYIKRGHQLKILFIEQAPDGTLEISIRIDKKFNLPGA